MITFRLLYCFCLGILILRGETRFNEIDFSEKLGLNETEAKAIIEQQAADKAARETRRKAELQSMITLESRIIQKNDHRVTINRVSPPRLKVAATLIPAKKERIKATNLRRI